MNLATTLLTPLIAATALPAASAGSPASEVIVTDAQNRPVVITITPAEKAAGHMRGITRMASTTDGEDSTNLSIPIAAGSNTTIKITRDGASPAIHDGGALTLHDGTGAFLLELTAPEGVDDQGNPVPLHAAPTAGGIRLAAEAPNGRAVTAHLLVGHKFTKEVKWNRDAGNKWGPTAQVFPSDLGRKGYPWDRGDAWDEVKGYHKDLNANNMKDQYLCHFDVVSKRAPHKASWNLDKKRPDVGYAKTVAAQCNPGGGED